MPMKTRQREIFSQTGEDGTTQNSITTGIVVDTNDPQQMGRVRAVCQQWGDRLDQDVSDVPWAIYCTPFGGQTHVGTRGPGVQNSEGGIAYGMWAIPKIGASVLIMCVDGDARHRVWMGCVYDQFTPHTLPHGRFMYDDHPELEQRGGNMKPAGPYTSREKSVNPLFDNLKQAFGHKDDPNYEWRSRAADYTVAGVDVSYLGYTYSKVADDKEFKFDNWNSTQGYQMNRQDPNAVSKNGKNCDSMVYSITSPGFHSLSMDDRMENCRIRIRTTAGHQLIFDDTNERVYLATAKGNNWIELDEDGNIDIFTANKVNVRAKEDINFTSDKSVRIYGQEGVHIYSGTEIRLQSAEDMSIKSGQSIKMHSSQSTNIQSDSSLNMKSGSDVKLTAGGTLNLLAGGDIIETGSNIHLNGPGAAASPAAGEQPAFWTNRVPDHEPWARVMTASDMTHDPEFSYTDANVNKSERGRPIVRGMYWRR